MNFTSRFQLPDGSNVRVDNLTIGERSTHEFNIAYPNGNTDQFITTLPLNDAERNEMAKVSYSRLLAIDEYEKRLKS